MFNIKKIFYSNNKSSNNRNNNQINLLKYSTSNASNETASMSSTSDNISISNNTACHVFKEDLILDNIYKIIKPVHEKEYECKAIYLVRAIHDQSKYILKVKSYEYRSNTNNINNELKVFNLLKKHINNYNKNVIEPHNYKIVEGNYYYYVYKYFDGVDLSKYMKNHSKNKLSESAILKIFIQIVDGLRFLHSLNIVHSDLKLENVIINKYKQIKIIDFDLSNICFEVEGFIADCVCGTINYISPESYDLCVYSKKSDIWSLGVILYIMLSGKYPNPSTISFSESFNSMYRRNEFKHIKFDYEELEKKYDDRVIKLLKQMLSFEDYKRDDTDTIYNILVEILKR